MTPGGWAREAWPARGEGATGTLEGFLISNRPSNGRSVREKGVVKGERLAGVQVQFLPIVIDLHSICFAHPSSADY